MTDKLRCERMNKLRCEWMNKQKDCTDDCKNKTMNFMIDKKLTLNTK